MDPSRLKIVVFGSFNAGKSTFIQAIDPASRHVEAECADGTTTVALDFGKAEIGSRHVHLYGTPGQERFEFVRQIISNGMDGAILMVDCSSGIDENTRHLYQQLKGTGVPLSVMLNKCDLSGACPAMIEQELGGAVTYEISARNPRSSRDALEQFVGTIGKK
ncbi:MAG: GTP-binding protein [Methanomicrobiales archaeon]|nr:GTP-binding protein [Methanomicrobiales archaeon]NYT21331.1 GTP-binding protein [Methanomicrobiales archaeon]